MEKYLRKIVETKYFGSTEDYNLIKQLLEDMYTGRLLRNFYYFFEIEIPKDFYENDEKLTLKINEIPTIYNKPYFTPLHI